MNPYKYLILRYHQLSDSCYDQKNNNHIFTNDQLKDTLTTCYWQTVTICLMCSKISALGY